MKLGYFYFIDEQYFLDFQNEQLMKNKEKDYNSSHNRPCYYAIKEEKSNIYWMIPISSKIDKYKRLYQLKIKRYKKCDTIVFGNVLGSEKAFLIQNMFPITDRYVSKVYYDLSSNEFVKVDNILKQELYEKAGRVLSLERKGVKLLFVNALEIESKLIETQLNNKESKETKAKSVMKALKKVQKEFEGAAKEADLKSEDDVENLLKENKRS